jgi:hypothetical protein
MWTLIRNGGVPMLFILVAGVITLVSAFYFALRPMRRSLGFIEAMARATLYSTLAGTAAAVGSTLYAAARFWDRPAPHGGPLASARLIVEGFAESTSAAILGFSFLALAWLLTAVGRRRLDDRSVVE